jgi:hypothetical protein
VALGAGELDEVVRAGSDMRVDRRGLGRGAVATFTVLVFVPPLFAAIPITPPTPTRMAAASASSKR